MKSQRALALELLKTLSHELGEVCAVDTTRDLKTVARRIEHEGWSFLTITLPGFANDLMVALDRGFVDHDLFQGFSFGGGLPRFLGGFLDLVFDRANGQIRDVPSHDAIYAMRQITMLYGKILLETTEKRDRAALDGYVLTDKLVEQADDRRSSDDIAAFHRMSHLLWGDDLADVNNMVVNHHYVPRHGPGATADKLKGNKKFAQSEWTQRLEEVFPAWENLVPNWHFNHVLDRVRWLKPGAERPVRVITVPKTMKTPRIIAVEPTCMQYMQQAVLGCLVPVLERTKNSFVGFTSQVPNQDMARRGSQDQSLATLDLSEASDRVSWQLVQEMLKWHPPLLKAVDATRSRTAVLKDGRVINLSKFASMGSALCFPMEALVFSTIVFLGIERAAGVPLSRDSIEELRGQVRVYGDDIIVPNAYAATVASTLEDFGLKVNSAKSFWTGKFRESCGTDYYDGTDVGIVRYRQLWPESRQSASELVSAVSFRNQLYARGLWKTVAWLDERIERLIPFPAVGPDSPVLGKHSFLGYETQRVSVDLQRPEVRGMVVKAKSPVNKIDDYAALMKWFLKQGDLPFADEEHLVRSGRPDVVYLKRQWAPAY